MPTIPVYDERQLLLRLASDDKEAFASLYHQHRDMVKQFVVKFVKSRELSDDIVQEVFIKIWENRRRLGEIHSFKAYLLVVSQNHTFSFLKTAAQNQKATDELIRSYSQSRSHTDEKLLSKEYWQCLEKILQTLPRQTQNVFSLCRQQDKTYDEVARVLGISNHAVKKHMMRANRIFKSSVKSLLDISFKLLGLLLFLKINIF